MAQFVNNLYMCRPIRSVRLYRTVYDKVDSGLVFPGDGIFISGKQYIGNQIEMFHITECGQYPAMVGYWCSRNMIQTIPIEDHSESVPTNAPNDAIILTGKVAHINGKNSKIYVSYDGSKEVPNGLKIGDNITIDYGRNTLVNGTMQTRYHIAANSGEDQTIIGNWLLHNNAVTIIDHSEEPSEEYTELVREATVFNNPYAIRPMAASSAIDVFVPGQNMPETNQENYNIFDHIPSSWKQYFSDDWLDRIRAVEPDWKIPDSWKTGMLPENWYNDLSAAVKANVPAIWANLQFPDIPAMVSKYVPDDWMDSLPAGFNIPDDWKLNGAPADWYDQIMEILRTSFPGWSLPEDWRDLEIPIKSIGGAIKDTASKVGEVVINSTKFVIGLLTGSEEDEVTVGNFEGLTDDELMYAYYQYYNSSDQEDSTFGYPIGKMLFVHGMPFQFTGITDRRLTSTNSDVHALDNVDFELMGKKPSRGTDAYGRYFAKEIASNIPIATIVPGKPKFMTNVKQGFPDKIFDFLDNLGGSFVGFITGTNTSKRATIGGQLLTMVAGERADLQSALENMDFDGNYEYYSLELDTSTYFEYVNTMCHTSARLLGISKQELLGTPCENLDWGKYNSDEATEYGMFADVLGQGGGVAFAFDPNSGGISDTINTQTTESSIGSVLNQVSSKAREVEFLLGYSGIDVSSLIDSFNFSESVPANIDSGPFQAVRTALDRVTTWGKNSLHGMNIRFPEIWQESSHQRSYEITMHFISPYGSRFCKWRYVLVPFFHVFALAAPRSDKNVAQYRSPFLIKAFSKGNFNVEMGMIDTLNWKRFGEGNMISADGVPLQIDVEISFKDLYHVLTMTNMYRTDSGAGYNMSNFFANTGFMDMIGTLSGVNMNRISLSDRIALFAKSNLDMVKNAPGNSMRRFSDHIRNFMENFYGTA